MMPGDACPRFRRDPVDSPPCLAPPRRFADCYVRATLVSYGASCKVMTAFNKVTNQKVAIKTIQKVSRWYIGSGRRRGSACEQTLREDL